MAPPSLRRRVGYLFQTPHLFAGTVRDNIEYAQSGLSPSDIAGLADQCRIKPELIDRDVTYLSIGEKQRVALARLMATGPDVALLDEPTSALDPANTEAIEALIKSLVTSCRLTVILVTHDPHQALRVGGEALLMVDGRLVQAGTASDIVEHPRTEEARRYINAEMS
jgi:putative ABC transport system ATP-binding protein